MKDFEKQQSNLKEGNKKEEAITVAYDFLEPNFKSPFLIELKEKSSTLQFVQTLIENAKKHSGPLTGDAFEVLLHKSALALPSNERQEVGEYLAKLPNNSLKNLNRETTSTGQIVQNSIVDTVVSSASKEWGRPLATLGVQTVLTSVGGPIGVVAPLVVKPVVDIAFEAGSKIGNECVKLAEKEAAKVVNTTVNQGIQKVKNGILTAYDKFSGLIPGRGTATKEATVKNNEDIKLDKTTSTKLIEIISEKEEIPSTTLKNSLRGQA